MGCRELKWCGGSGLLYDGWNTHKICGTGRVVRVWLHGLVAGFPSFLLKGCDGAHIFLFECLLRLNLIC